MPETPFPRLFAPLELRGRRIRNRIVSAPHTTSMGVGGLPGERHRDYYVERAAGGVGLIVMEPVPAHETAYVTAANFRHDDDAIVEPLAELVAAVRAEGAALCCQIYHVGGFTNPLASMRERWGPSPLQLPGLHERVHAPTREEIREVVAGFARAAVRAARADADGVEVSIGHLGLVDSFMSPFLNRRTDEYGGSFEKRLRLAREVLLAVREALGPDRIMGTTMSGDHLVPEGSRAEELARNAAALVGECGVDYVGVTSGSYLAMHMIIPPMDVEEGLGLRFSRVYKEAVPEAAILAEGRIKRPETGERALAEGACDLVGMTRALIADPELPEKARTGRAGEICLCIGCNQSCWGRRAHQFFVSCAVNAAAGDEGRYGRRRLTPVARARRVVVVGGGPAGLEAARVAAARGHEVVLWERAPELGGQALLAARMPRHGEFAEAVEYRRGELERLGVRVELGRAAGVEEVAALAPDAVVVATGSTPDRSGHQPALGAGVALADGASARVFTAVDVLAGAALPDGDVVVLDGEGHRKALGTAELLAAQGRRVAIVTSDLHVGSELAAMFVLPTYLERLGALGVRLLPLAAVTAFDGETARVRSLYDGGEEPLPAAALVLATPHLANDALTASLRGRGLDPLVIGDAQAPRLLDAAIRDGLRAGFAL